MTQTQLHIYSAEIGHEPGLWIRVPPAYYWCKKGDQHFAVKNLTQPYDAVITTQLNYWGKLDPSEPHNKFHPVFETQFKEFSCFLQQDGNYCLYLKADKLIKVEVEVHVPW